MAANHPKIAIGPIALGAIPRIAVPLTDEHIPTRVSEALRWADIVELRVDMFSALDERHVAAVCRETRAAGAPVLTTVRCRRQGGAVELSDERRLTLYESAAPSSDAFDIELRSPLCDAVLALAARNGIVSIASHHDFDQTPDTATLNAIADEARDRGAAIVKIATTARNPGDRNRLLDVLRQRPGQAMIAIAMGEHGAASRVFFPLCGSLITYGFLDGAVSPGQLSIHELRAELERYCPELRAGVRIGE